jgi:hypothetical protein
LNTTKYDKCCGRWRWRAPKREHEWYNAEEVQNIWMIL